MRDDDDGGADDEAVRCSAAAAPCWLATLVVVDAVVIGC